MIRFIKLDVPSEKCISKIPGAEDITSNGRKNEYLYKSEAFSQNSLTTLTCIPSHYGYESRDSHVKFTIPLNYK